MTYDPLKHHRRSFRLKGYDYAQPGAYFVTLCAQHRECPFTSEPVRAMIQRRRDKLPEKFSRVRLDEFVIMPNYTEQLNRLVRGLSSALKTKSDEASQCIESASSLLIRQ